MLGSMRALAALLVLALLAACVPVPDDMKDEVAPPSSLGGGGRDSSPFAPLDDGGAESSGLHFRVRAYGQDAAARIEQDAEASFGRLTNDANLIGFQPGKPYDIVVYGSQSEYHSKTQQPASSDAVVVGGTLYTYYGPALAQTVAHHMTHLVLREYLGNLAVRNADYRWIDEGLACYEESAAARTAGDSSDLFAPVRALLRSQPLAMTQILQMPPNNDYGRASSMWFAESESLVEFMLLKGRPQFAEFVQSIRDGRTSDQSITRAFPGQFIDLNSFYVAWDQSLSQ